ncbi:hypothetical protein [Virgibacillus salexigens]|uniref:Uncharacterized protein n=2 Tax=Virgibacillus TaxID=84406 RepID=A0A024QE83_9BACI|nr:MULTISPECIES: hypothetical protein [Virgibacillus]MYL42593.1 hypothetical protein [Virgibacillus massiliensis]GGJ73819.1 hypothetical protein GCM10007111_39320 [Virgibacillus kapii]CDQ40475.1 hypothetical protein BN990_02799 [Virgibacillus massiliensis]
MLRKVKELLPVLFDSKPMKIIGDISLILLVFVLFIGLIIFVYLLVSSLLYNGAV